MKTIRWVLAAVGVLALLLAGMAWRTAQLKPPAPIAMALPPAAPVDLDRAARHLGEAIRFQTVSHQDPAENTPRAWDDQRAWLQTTYPRFHAAATRQIVAGGALIYAWKGSDPSLAPIILMAHQDVVPVAEETRNLWKADPFGGEIRDGAVWGRGSMDDKGNLVSLFEAAEDLAARGFQPKRTILIVSGADEEVSGASMRAAAAELKRQGVRAQFALDEGMVILKRFPVTGTPVAIIGVAEKGYATLRLTARSAGGHSSAPPKDTAAVSIARAVVAINDHGFPLRYDGPTRQMTEALAPQMGAVPRFLIANDWLFGPLIAGQIAASDQGAASLHTTTAPTMLQGSPKENALPALATARINYRIAPGDTAAGVMARARAAVGSLPVELSFEGGAAAVSDPSPVSSTQSASYRLLAALAADVSHAPVVPGLVTAATDSRHLRDVTEDTYRFQPVTFEMRDVEMIHGANEHLSLDNLRTMVSFYTRLMQAAAG